VVEELVDVARLVADVDGEEQVAARRQHAPALGEAPGPL
jgi:hypothetical protein